MLVMRELKINMTRSEFKFERANFYAVWVLSLGSYTFAPLGEYDWQ